MFSPINGISKWGITWEIDPKVREFIRKFIIFPVITTTFQNVRETEIKILNDVSKPLKGRSGEVDR